MLILKGEILKKKKKGEVLKVSREKGSITYKLDWQQTLQQ